MQWANVQMCRCANVQIRISEGVWLYVFYFLVPASVFHGIIVASHSCTAYLYSAFIEAGQVRRLPKFLKTSEVYDDTFLKLNH